MTGLESRTVEGSETNSTHFHDRQQRQHQQYAADNSLSLAGRRWAVLLFSLSTILLFADQNLMSPNLTAIAKEFGFTDQERDQKLGGEIALAFFVLGAPASFFIGCLADTFNRSRLFAATVLIGEGSCLATYWTTTYPQLYACRAITGFSVGGALPLIYSILGDLYPADERHTVSAAVSVGTGVGIALGQGVAGFLGPAFGWRLPFAVVSIPALFCGLLVWWTVPDPPRGMMEQAVLEQQRQQCEECWTDPSAIEMLPLGRRTDDQQQMSSMPEEEALVQNLQSLNAEYLIMQDPLFDFHRHWVAFRSLLYRRTVCLALLQGAPGCVPWGIVNMYLNDFLSEDRGMTVEYATFTVLLFGFGNFLGITLGGGGATYLYRIDKRYPPLLAGTAAMMGCIPFWILLNTIDASTSLLWNAIIAILAGLGSGVTGPIIKAELQNVTLPRERGQAFALFNTTDDFGRGLGPVIVAALIVKMGGRTPAFNVGVLGWLVCGLLNSAVYFTIQEDEQSVQCQVAAMLSPKKQEHISEASTTITLEQGVRDDPILFKLHADTSVQAGTTIVGDSSIRSLRRNHKSVPLD